MGRNNGTLERIRDTDGTHWARPWVLRAGTGFCLVVVGTFETEGQARAAAKRRGIRLPAPARRPSVRQVRALARLEVL